MRLTVSQEMLDAVMIYREYCLNQHIKNTKQDPLSSMLTEKKFSLEPYIREGFGTIDCVLLTESSIEIIDYKHGQGVLVEVMDNSQLWIYLLAVYISLPKDHQDAINELKVTVVQPRKGHPDGPIRSQEVDKRDLLRFGVNVKLTANLIYDDPEKALTILSAGLSQCRWCRALAHCPEARKVATETAAKDFEDDDITEEEISDIYSKVPLIRQWCNAVEGFVFEQLLTGKSCGDFKLVKGRANRTWKNEEEVLEVLDLYIEADLDTFAPRKVLSVAQMEKALGKTNKDLLKDLIFSPEGKPTIAPKSDPRPEYVLSAAKDFEDL